MKSTLLRLLATIAAVLLLGGCASVEVADYRAERPLLDLRQFFSGQLEGWGMFQDRSGKVIKRFHVVIDAKWQGDTGTLDERFTWSDGPAGGNPERRVWTLTDLGGGRYGGTAGDVVGVAAGEVAGNALRWRYVLALPVDGKVVEVDFDDWMYLVDDKVMLNRSFMSKYGFHLGEVTLTLMRRPS
jgi:hypothetical protein